MNKIIKQNQIISKTENGIVFKCSKCNKIHIEYKNLNFNFTQKEYEHFANYFLNLDGKYWENRNQQSFYCRKIIVPIGHNNFNVLLNNQELEELKQLFAIKEINFINHFKLNICVN